MSNTKKANNKVVPIFVAVDDGSGNVEHRFVDKSGEVFEGKTPSCVVPRVLPSIGGGVSDHAWKTEEGHSFSVTNSSPDAYDTCSKDYQLSEANRVLVHNTLAVAGVGGLPVFLGVTLPTEQFYTRGADDLVNKARIEAKKANLMKGSKNLNGVYPTPNVVGVTVYPEAIPAYVYCSTLNPEVYPEQHKTLVIDLGRFTCDMAIITTNYNVEDYLTTEHGVQVLAEKFKVLLQQNAHKHDISDISAFSSTDIDGIITRGYIGSSLETEGAIAARKDVSEEVQAAKAHLNELIINDARRLVRGDFSMLTRIVFVGGGANWLKELSTKWHHTVDIPEDPEMAIVRGTHMMLEQASGKLVEQVTTMADESVEA
ncbi:ParM/StbA family protein (plasmid) [Photobacterium sp. CCB-ST2H9]|uniref:ParM/StbA family protein n=1 Tax=Photobacterium sp. CCB-ST2H9 TaxID=2912855 RepID=UPI002004A947|nr:ParM/StbA family protein [Photobacterium sp. CCB-ST2H9]UTM60459.1 ParM/StbA family protein [Photobacterium sp. CCB-ST2H9]